MKSKNKYTRGYNNRQSTATFYKPVRNRPICSLSYRTYVLAGSGYDMDKFVETVNIYITNDKSSISLLSPCAGIREVVINLGSMIYHADAAHKKPTMSRSVR